MREHVFKVFFFFNNCELGDVQKVYYIEIWRFVELYSLFAFLSVVLPVSINAHRMILQDCQSGMYFGVRRSN